MYHYTDGGLTNVWLQNGYIEHKTPYGKAVSFHDLDGLVQAICHALVNKPTKLTGKEYRFIRQNLLMSQASIGKMLGCTEQTVSLWERHGKVPLWADKFLRMTYMAHADGNETVRDVIDRLNFVDRVVNQKIVIEETQHGWESRTEELIAA